MSVNVVSVFNGCHKSNLPMIFQSIFMSIFEPIVTFTHAHGNKMTKNAMPEPLDPGMKHLISNYLGTRYKI